VSARPTAADNPGWGHPPLEDEVRMTDEGWGLVTDPGSLFGPTTVRWYPAVQWLDGDGFADLIRSTSLYRGLDRRVREPLLDAIAERIRTRMGDRASRRYLSVLRAGQHAECHSGGGSLIQLHGLEAVAARPTATLVP
jgi:hypothetical protein